MTTLGPKSKWIKSHFGLPVRLMADVRGETKECEQYKCKHCETVIKVTQKGNFTQLESHLCKEHGLSATNREPDKPGPKQMTLEQTLLGSSGFTDAQKGFIYENTRVGTPNSIFDTPGVRMLMGASFTSGKYVEGKMLLAKESLEKMAESLRNAKTGQSTLAFDLGTVDGIHFLNIMILNPHVEAAYLLSAVQLVGPATAETIEVYLQQAIAKFTALRCGHLSAICCDNALNVTNAAKAIVAKHPHMIFFPCSCHVMNLASESYNSENAVLIDSNVLKKLISLRLMKRWCPTRWWSMHESFRGFTQKTITPAHRKEVDTLNALLAAVQTYVDDTTPLRAAGRSLERDRAHMPLAVYCMLKCAERPKLRKYVMNRFIKFYASIGPLIFAFLSPHSHKALDQWDADEWTTRITNLMHDIFLAVSKHKGKNFESVDIKKVVQFWSNSEANTTPLTQIGSDISAYGTYRNGDNSRVLHMMITYVCGIGASEASAERSFSRLKHMRDRRFHLSAVNSEIELIVGFNPRPTAISDYVASRARRSDAGKKYPRLPSSTADERHTKVVITEGTPDVAAVAALPAAGVVEISDDEAPATTEAIEQLPEDVSDKDTCESFLNALKESNSIFMVEPEHTPFLTADECRAVFSVHMFGTLIWPSMEDQVDRVNSALDGAVQALRRDLWCHYSDGKWVATKLFSVDKQSRTAKVSFDTDGTSTNQTWDLFDCWSRCLQPSAIDQRSSVCGVLWWNEGAYMRNIRAN